MFKKIFILSFQIKFSEGLVLKMFSMPCLQYVVSYSAALNNSKKLIVLSEGQG